jgi:hypothetical protein
VSSVIAKLCLSNGTLKSTLIKAFCPLKLKEENLLIAEYFGVKINNYSTESSVCRIEKLR